MKPNIVYHYFPLTYIQSIDQCGFLRVSEWERKNKIKKPALWFSANPVIEPTAIKMARSRDGQIHSLTFEQQHEQFGVGRISIRYTDELMTWAKYKYTGCASSEIYQGMEQVGIDRGARPSDWYALFRNSPESEWIEVEKWDGSTWVRF